MSYSVSTGEELQRYCKRAQNSTKRIVDQYMPSMENFVPESKKSADPDAGSKLFEEDVEDGWTDINIEGGDLPKEDHVEKYRLAHGIGRIEDIGGKIQEKALQLALEARGASKLYASTAMQLLAENVGFFTHCKTTEDAVRAILAQYPSLMDIKNAYKEGRKLAVRNSQQKKMIDQIRRERYAESDGEGVEMREGRDMTARLRELYQGGGAERPKRPSILDEDAGEMEDVPLDDEEEEHEDVDVDWEVEG